MIRQRGSQRPAPPLLQPEESTEASRKNPVPHLPEATCELGGSSGLPGMLSRHFDG